MGQLPVFPEETQHAGGVRITTLGLLLFFGCAVSLLQCMGSLVVAHRLRSQWHMVLVGLGHVGS